MRNIFLTYRFFATVTIISLLFILGYSYEVMITIAYVLLGLSLLIIGVEVMFLRNIVKGISINRRLTERLSLGEKYEIKYDLKYDGNRAINVELVDELPTQLQYRKSIGSYCLNSDYDNIIAYEITPLSRGNYHFGDINIFASFSFPGFVQFKKQVTAQKKVKVFPSIEQMRKFELQVFAKTAIHSGIRKIRKLGENDEFESIRPYVVGDNIKSINWKATSKTNMLMINQYQNTRSQQVYSVIDKGRSMEMPFNGLSLLDHSINSALVLSNIILKKYDKAGLITFSNEVDQIVKSENKNRQIEFIANKLYGQKTSFLESNFEKFYFTIRNKIKQRSILFFYTNFETNADLNRNYNYLKNLNKLHLLVVIIFENVEVKEASMILPLNKKDIYFRTMATSSVIEKEKMAMRLNANGIMTILTSPKDLNIKVINKYLELKAKHRI